MTKILPALGLLALLAGCASTGNKMEKSDIDKIQKGVTTRAEVEAKLGPAIGGVGILPNGDRQARYTYTESKANGFSYIPYVSVFAGGSDNRIQALVIVYDQNNIVKDYDFTDAGGKTSGGAFNAQHTWTNTPETK